MSGIRGFIFSMVLLVICGFLGCCSFPLKYDSDLPKNYKVSTGKLEKVKVSRAWQLRQPGKRYSLSSDPMANYVKWNFVRNHYGEEGDVIGEVPSLSGSNPDYVIKFGNNIFFIDHGDLSMYHDYEKYIISKNDSLYEWFIQGGIYGGAGLPPQNSLLVGLSCVFCWDIDYRSSILNDVNELMIASKQDSIYLGKVSERLARGFFKNRSLPVAMYCGTFIDRKPLETQSGYLRNFSMYQIEYIVFDWDGLLIVSPLR